jgi:hypothetical protein
MPKPANRALIFFFVGEWDVFTVWLKGTAILELKFDHFQILDCTPLKNWPISPIFKICTARHQAITVSQGWAYLNGKMWKSQM